jgi:CarboxypepD_reg-like domain
MKRAHLASITLLLVLLTALPRVVAGQGTWILSGRVLDAQTEGPIPGAFVSVGESNLGIVTDSLGLFRLRIEREPGQTLRISQLGYREIQAPVDPSRAGQILTVMLAPDPLQMEGLTVVMGRLADRRRGIFGVGDILERSQLLKAPDVSGYDLVLRMLPFVDVCDPESEALCMVGRLSMGEKTKVSVCLDDSAVPAELMQVVLATVDPRSLYLVEVYPRAGAVRMYSPAYMKRLVESGRDLPPLAFGCQGAGIPGPGGAL